MQKDDVIYRQAAIDMLKNRWKKTRNYEGIGDDIAEECELYLKQVPSAQRWIPVTERLPEESSPWRTGYLATVTCDTWSEPSVMYVQWETTMVRGKEVSRWIWNDRLFPKCWHLVAWMPLPTPYREGGQDNA